MSSPFPDDSNSTEAAEATASIVARDELRSDVPAGPSPTVNGVRFAHASEAEMARILDFYEVRWHYEPTTFPILWNLDGGVVESFAPDFYLPDLDVFLEMTTLKQRLVRKKNRKLRRLRELYPDVRIKLFYARDFRAMMLKYGRLGLVESLSGTSGQVVPERPAVVASPEAIEAPAIVAALVGEAATEGLVLAVPAREPVDAVGMSAAAKAESVIGTARGRARTRPSSRRRRRAARWAEAAAEQEHGA